MSRPPVGNPPSIQDPRGLRHWLQRNQVFFVGAALVVILAVVEDISPA